jgi:hypothetical protein
LLMLFFLASPALCLGSPLALSSTCTRIDITALSHVPAANSLFDGCDAEDSPGGALFSTADDLAITLINCHFLWCRSNHRGGAIYISSASVGVTVIACTFDSCHSLQDAACIYANRCSSFVMNETVAFNCTSDGVGALCNAGVEDAAVGRLYVCECSATFCGSWRDTFCLGFYEYSTGPMSYLHLTNASDNWATVGGTAASLSGQVSLSLRFCQFASNVRGNCLKLSNIVDNDILCLEIVNNTCISTADGYKGLLVVIGHEATFTSCVFQMNTYDAFVGGEEATVTFVGCILDGQPLNATGDSMAVATASCVYELSRTGLADCGWAGHAAGSTSLSRTEVPATAEQTRAIQSGSFTVGWETFMQPRQFWRLTAFLICAGLRIN